VGIALGLGVPVLAIVGYRVGFIRPISRSPISMLACPVLILAIALAAFWGPSSARMIAIGSDAADLR